MSNIGPKKLYSRAGRLKPIAERSPNTPYLLLWSTGLVAFVLCVVAFVLWGVIGPRTLFDTIVALCS